MHSHFSTSSIRSASTLKRTLSRIATLYDSNVEGDGEPGRLTRLRRHIVCGLAVLVIQSCAIEDLLHLGGNEPVIVPTVRFAVYSAELGYYQDISDGHPDAAPLVEGIKVAPVGPMKVACDGVQEIGVMFRYFRRARLPDAFNYVLYKGGEQELAPDHFVYEIQRHGWQLRGAARFRGSPKNGIVTFAVTHREKVILSTEFDLVGCK